MESAAKHVLADGDVADMCKRTWKEFPTVAFDLAVKTNSELGLLVMIGHGETHVVDKLVQAKTVVDKIKEQPNTVVASEPHVQTLMKDIDTVTQFMDKFLIATLKKIHQVCEEADIRSELVTSDNLMCGTDFKCLWKFLRAWKAGPGPINVDANKFNICILINYIIYLLYI